MDAGTLPNSTSSCAAVSAPMLGAAASGAAADVTLAEADDDAAAAPAIEAAGAAGGARTEGSEDGPWGDAERSNRCTSMASCCCCCCCCSSYGSTSVSSMENSESGGGTLPCCGLSASSVHDAALRPQRARKPMRGFECFTWHGQVQPVDPVNVKPHGLRLQALLDVLHGVGLHPPHRRRTARLVHQHRLAKRWSVSRREWAWEAEGRRTLGAAGARPVAGVRLTAARFPLAIL